MKVVTLPGDGIGYEIMQAGVEVLKTAAEIYDFAVEIEEHSFGGAGIDQCGDPLPKTTLEACQKADAILLGAIGGPKWDAAPKRPEMGLLALRKALGLYANIRPTKVTDILAKRSPLRPELVSGTDLVIVRELTGGIYFGEPRELTSEQAIDTCVYSREEIRRIIIKAFDLAMTRNKKVTSVDKANVLATSKLWREVANEVANEYPEVTLEHQLVDSAAMILIQQPTAFDVIVTENLFGDILSDEASVIPGSLGMLPSASLSENGPALYEPIHGSAPDIAGKDIANPMSMILSVVMMLRQSFGIEEAAKGIETACDKVMQAGFMTSDLGGNTSTTEFTAKVIAELRRTGK